jgi:carbonic anhydrase/acetyltransferase-like protein (isoleucine patch superfamily)
MIRFYLKHIRFIKKFDFFLPFLIYNKVNVEIKKSATLQLTGRLRFGDKLNPNVSFLPSSLILDSNSFVKIEEGVIIGGGSLIFSKKNSNLCIGKNTYFTSGLHLECVNKITIGENCAISWGVTIIDDDHHQIIYDNKRVNKDDSNVVIGDKVWVGCNVTILKNTKIGNNCVVAAGSIVKGEFPDNVLIAGNPAQIIKRNVSWI